MVIESAARMHDPFPYFPVRKVAARKGRMNQFSGIQKLYGFSIKLRHFNVIMLLIRIIRLSPGFI